MNDTSKLKKYLSNTKGLTIFFIVFMSLLLLFALMVYALDHGKGLTSTIIVLSVALFYAIPFLVALIVRNNRLKRDLEAVDAEGKTAELLQDFESAPQLFSDHVRLGNDHLFGFHAGRLIRYDQIEQVYQHVKLVYGIESERSVCVVIGKKRITLCTIRRKDKDFDEVLTLAAFIKNKNENVKIGYGKK